jgi:hypothetical protein
VKAAIGGLNKSAKKPKEQMAATGASRLVTQSAAIAKLLADAEAKFAQRSK